MGTPMGMKRTTPRKPLSSTRKKQSISAMKKKVWDVFSQYIRTRDCLRTTGCSSWGLCFTCDRRYHFKLLQAGHFVAGRHNAGLFSERGVQAQCYNCNMNLKGNTLEYRRRLIKLYGEGADIEIEEEARLTRKFTIPELEEIKEDLKNKLKVMEGI